MTKKKTELDRIEERFDGFMVDEYGKWKIGRTEVKAFYRKEIEELVKKLIGEEREIDDGYLDGMYHEQTHGYNEKRQEIIANAKSFGINLD